MVATTAPSASGVPQKSKEDSKEEATNNVTQTVILIVAEMAGGGILSFPKAVSGAGLWLGLVLVLIAGLVSAYTGEILARCYAMTKQRRAAFAVPVWTTNSICLVAADLENQTKNAGKTKSEVEHDTAGSYLERSPYACIAGEACGNAGVFAVTGSQIITLIGVSVVFLLISGINLNMLFPQHSALFYSMVCTLLIAPLTLLRPGHVWGTAIIAVIASVALAIVIIILCATDTTAAGSYTPLPTPTFATFGQSFGAILFGFGGHALFPALQSTMKKPEQFRYAIGNAYFIVLTMYISVSAVAVTTFGGSTESNILQSFTESGLQKFGIVAVTAHLLFAVITIQLPVGQILDHCFHVNKHLGVRHVCVRVATMGLTAVTLWGLQSKFFCVIALIGGTTTNLMTLVFPSLFYLLLLEPEERTLKVGIVQGAIILLGLAALVLSLWGAITGDCA